METVKVAVPLAGGRLSPHFGHCETFAIITLDKDNKSIVGKEEVPAPSHEPGLLPRWLKEQGVQLVIAGGMGSRAQSLFADSNISVIVGAPLLEPQDVVLDYLNGTLTTAPNSCDH